MKRQKTGGRQKGTPNKLTGELKDIILAAAEAAGGDEGMFGYLKAQALAQPVAYLTLLGKVLPQTIQADVTHTYVAELPMVATSSDEWQKQVAPKLQ